MKRASEYLGKEEFLSRVAIEEIIKQVQIDTIDETVELCSVMADVHDEYMTIVDKNSILNCAKILKEEL